MCNHRRQPITLGLRNYWVAEHPRVKEYGHNGMLRDRSIFESFEEEEVALPPCVTSSQMSKLMSTLICKLAVAICFILTHKHCFEKKRNNNIERWSSTAIKCTVLCCLFNPQTPFLATASTLQSWPWLSNLKAVREVSLVIITVTWDCETLRTSHITNTWPALLSASAGALYHLRALSTDWTFWSLYCEVIRSGVMLVWAWSMWFGNI